MHSETSNSRSEVDSTRRKSVFIRAREVRISRCSLPPTDAGSCDARAVADFGPCRVTLAPANWRRRLALGERGFISAIPRKASKHYEEVREGGSQFYSRIAFRTLTHSEYPLPCTPYLKGCGLCAHNRNFSLSGEPPVVSQQSRAGVSENNEWKVADDAARYRHVVIRHRIWGSGRRWRKY
jgi:hypothetical protein